MPATNIPTTSEMISSLREKFGVEWLREEIDRLRRNSGGDIVMSAAAAVTQLYAKHIQGDDRV